MLHSEKKNLRPMTKNEFIHTIRQFIADGKTEEALDLLCEKIKDYDTSVLNDSTLLKSRFQNAKNDCIVKGIMLQEDYNRTNAQVNYAILELLEQLEKTTIISTKGSNDKSSGRILHNIPGTMSLGRENRCIVRIAYDDITLTKDFEMTKDTVIQSVRIAEVMGVELLDFNETPAFQIRTVTEQEQFVASDDFTQWIFKVKPLVEGKFPLTLKVAVIEEIDGKERKRDIVLEKEVFVISQLEEPATPPARATVSNDKIAFEETNVRLNYVLHDDTTVATTTQATKKRSTTAIVSALATVIFAITGFFVYQNVNLNKAPDIVFNEKTDTVQGKNDHSTKNDSELVENQTKDKNDPFVSEPEKTDTLQNQVIESRPNAVKEAPKPKIDNRVATTTKKPTKRHTPVTADKNKTKDPIAENDRRPAALESEEEPEGVPSPTIPIDEKKESQKTYRVRIKLKDEMKNAQILVNGEKPMRVKNNIWGTPQYVEFKSNKKLQTLTFSKDGVSCTIDNVDATKSDVEVEACSFKKKKPKTEE